MLLRLGPDVVFGLEAEDKYGLLEILEEAGRFPEQFLCSECRRFHRPRLTKYWLDRGNNKDCDPLDYGSERECDATSLNIRHCEILRGMVAAVLRSHRLQNDIYPLNMLTTQKVYRLPSKTPGHVTRSAKARIRYGHLIVETEWAYSSEVPAGDADKATAVLRTMPAKWRPALSGPCPHTKWGAKFKPFLTQSPQFAQAGLRYRCLWEHDPSCKAAACGWSGGVAEISGCFHCFTDFQLSSDPAPGGGGYHRTLVLTAWQHYGRGDDSCWVSCHDGAATERGIYRIGLVKMAFETGMGQDLCRYN